MKDKNCVFCAGFGNVKGDTCWGCDGSGKDKDARINLGWEKEPEEFDRKKVKGYKKPEVDFPGIEEDVDLDNEEEFAEVIGRLIEDKEIPWSCVARNGKFVIGVKQSNGDLLIFELNAKHRATIYEKKKTGTKKNKTI